MKKCNVTFLHDGIYLIDELGGTNCYLILGTKKALLIDCGTGFADLMGTVRDITDLPIEAVATHGHVDHIGGAGVFPEIHVHKDDTAFLNRIQTSLFMRKIFALGAGDARRQGVRTGDVKRPVYKTKFIAIDESWSPDIGGKEIRIKHTPGHTKGSIAIIDETDKVIFSGDNVCDALWMFLPGAVTIEEWIPGAQWLYDMSLSYEVYWGHRKPRLESDYILQVINWAREIMAHSKRNAFISRKKQYPDRTDGIIYKTGKIFRR
ncbi:MAG: MBL fold metallo-hydrolase [Clostridiales bacterium]|nr:MBL fold metallo-hydrolase [Clostridiales bacterium]